MESIMSTSMSLTIGAIALLLVLCSFFSLAETALTAASRPRMHELEIRGDRRATLVNRLLARQEQMIGAILLGSNGVNILASALATSVFIAAFGEAGVFYASGVMTVLVLILGEVMPKSYAIANPDRTALTLAPILAPIVEVLAPITGTVQWIVRGLLRLIRRGGTDADEEAQAEALRGAIELHRGPDADIHHERAMLRSILDLTDVDVGKIMIHRKDVVMVNADAPTQEIVDQVLESLYTRIPMYRGDPENVVGVLHAKEVLRVVRDHRGDIGSFNLAQVTAKPWFIPESTSLLEQLHAFRQKREHIALVVDEYGSLMGIVTLEDIIEEIVGDISDEHDVVLVGVRPQADGSYVVDGSVTVRDLNRRFEWHLPDDQAATIAGLVIHEARVIPEAGQIFRFHGFRFEIARRERNQITLLRITPPKRASEDDEGEETG
jgi:Mg2+/Co2+ transporter CorB